MKEKYQNDLNFIEKLLGVWRVNKDSYDTNWGYFAPRFGFDLILNRGGYFDQRYSINICFIFGSFLIHLPIKTKIPESCDTPRYGIAVHNNTFWIYLGVKMNDWEQCDSKWITWNLPFVNHVFDYHHVLDINGNWIEYNYEDKTIAKETYDFSYQLKSGEIQERKAECYREIRCWHRKWLPFIKMYSECINVDFDGEVGEKTGSWKGGTVGCGYDLLKNESIKDCLNRMQIEREFN